MKYELAKKLKDAGFVQSGKGARVAPPDKIVVRRDDFAYVPTLEELIEACSPNRNFRLWDDADTWHADHTVDVDTTISGIGETPTEAAARLWLALNSKRYARHEAHSGKN
jgi:hypothetical protein